jgi:hypothetical protein
MVSTDHTDRPGTLFVDQVTNAANRTLEFLEKLVLKAAKWMAPHPNPRKVKISGRGVGTQVITHHKMLPPHVSLFLLAYPGRMGIEGISLILHLENLFLMTSLVLLGYTYCPNITQA